MEGWAEADGAMEFEAQFRALPKEKMEGMVDGLVKGAGDGFEYVV